MYDPAKVIAEMAGIEHRKIKTAIRKHQADMESFGILAPYEPSNQQRGKGQPEVIYRLNEEQATFLMTLLKNTPIVVAFKKELVRQFFKMRQELTRRIIARESRKPVRREMTDAIRDCIPDGPHKNMMYKRLYKSKLDNRTCFQTVCAGFCGTVTDFYPQAPLKRMELVCKTGNGTGGGRVAVSGRRRPGRIKINTSQEFFTPFSASEK